MRPSLSSLSVLICVMSAIGRIRSFICSILECDGMVSQALNFRLGRSDAISQDSGVLPHRAEASSSIFIRWVVAQ